MLVLGILGTALAAPDLALTQQPAALPPQALETAFPSLSFERMTGLTHAGDGTSRLWVTTQAGQVMVFANDRQTATASVFLDIGSKVSTAGNEEGLLGLAFDPQYAANGYFYVYYSAANPRRSVVARFSVSASNPNRADSSSELVLLEVPQPFQNHNGGAITFGPDGYLYMGLGDGGSGGDPLGHGQNTATLLGSILRIDVGGATAQQPYRVPAGNPLVGAAGARDEIWAYGLRNPWRIAFDPATGELWAGDVGQGQYEEVDVIKKGHNYGWNVMEGFHCYPSNVQSCDQAGLEPPIFEYSHAEGCSITGGHVYRGSRIPQLSGAYIYADFCSGRIWGLRYDGATVTSQALLNDSALQIPSFGVDQQGELYILSFDGRIYQFVAPQPTPDPTPPTEPTAPSSHLPPPTGDLQPSVSAVQIIAVLGILMLLAGGLFLAVRMRKDVRPSS